MKPIRLFLMAPLFALLVGCLSVTPRGLLAMASFDPLNMNPADLGAGLGVPDTIRLQDGDAMLVMTYQLGTETTPTVNERFLLEIEDSATVAGTPSPDPGERIYIGRLSSLDAVRMKDVQDRIRRYKSEGLEGQGAFSIELRGGCTTAPPLAELLFRTFLRTAAGGSYIGMTRRTDIVASIPESSREEFLRSVRVCDDAD